MVTPAENDPRDGPDLVDRLGQPAGIEDVEFDFVVSSDRPRRATFD